MKTSCNEQPVWLVKFLIGQHFLMIQNSTKCFVYHITNLLIQYRLTYCVIFEQNRAPVMLHREEDKADNEYHDKNDAEDE